MASLITRLYMKEHKIISPQSIDCRFYLAFIIGIRKPCSTINIDNFQSGILSNTPNKIVCRNHSAASYFRIFLT